MSEELQNLIDELLAQAPRSKLEPYRELIFSLLDKNWRYRDIAELFKEKLGVSVAPSTLHNFVKVRSKRNRGASAMRSESKGQTVAAQSKDRPFVFTSGETLTLLPKERKEK